MTKRPADRLCRCGHPLSWHHRYYQCWGGTRRECDGADCPCSVPDPVDGKPLVPLVPDANREGQGSRRSTSEA
jgi:hypothetical protein